MSSADGAFVPGLGSDPSRQPTGLSAAASSFGVIQIPARAVRLQAIRSQELRASADLLSALRHALLASSCAIVAGLSGTSAALADDFTWTGNTNTDWFEANNWDCTPSCSPTPATDDKALFTNTVTNQPVLDGTVNLGTGTVRVDAGTLTIVSTGALTDQYGYVGYAPGSNGTATVTGTDSTWANTDRFYVGYAGTGILNVQDGGAVSNSDHGYIGFSSNGEGTVTVTGTGSTWTNSANLFVGVEGTGTLNVEDGGAVSNGNGSIGQSPGGNGTVTVTGTGSTWTNSANVFVGNNGTGTLTVADGGMVNANGGAGTTRVANGSGSTGTVNIGAAAGDTSAAPGTLNAASVVFGAGDGLLTFNHTDTSGTFVFDPEISGNGAIGHEAGYTNLTGDGAGFTGTTTVSGGRLAVNSTLGGSIDVTGGILSGSGEVGTLEVMSGGTVAPGNSIGTMTVNGNFTIGSGASYEAEVDAAGNNDKIVVNGVVNLTGAILDVMAANGSYADSTDYTIIENDGTDAVVGNFASITTNLAFLTPSVIYDGVDGNDVVLTLKKTVSFCSVANTTNQCNVGNALDTFPTGNALFLAVAGQTASGARQAFDALSGEIHATVAGTLADDSRYVREAMLGRLGQATFAGANTQLASLAKGGPQVAALDRRTTSPGYMALGFGDDDAVPAAGAAAAPLIFWTQAYGSWGNFDGNANAATAERNIGGFVSGMDADIGDGWRAGLATGASYSSLSVDARRSSADIESYYLGGYVGGMAGPFALRGGGVWAWSDIDTTRAVVFPGFYESQAAEYDADTGQIFGEIAAPMQVHGLALEPFAGLAYVSVDSDSFTEHGGAYASLTGSAGHDVGYTSFGLRAATTLYLSSMQVVPHASAAWQHAFDDVTPDAALAFADTGAGFNVAGVPLAQDSVILDAGLDLQLAPNVIAGVAYSGRFGDGVTDNGVKGRFSWRY